MKFALTSLFEDSTRVIVDHYVVRGTGLVIEMQGRIALGLDHLQFLIQSLGHNVGWLISS